MEKASCCFPQIGFEGSLSAKDAINPRALVQTEQEDFQELASRLPPVPQSLLSNLTMRWSGKPENRMVIPVLDSEGFCCLSLRVQKRGQREIIRPDSKNQDGPITRRNTPT